MKKMLKKLLVAFISILLVAAVLCSCSEAEEEETVQATPKPNPQNLVAQVKLSGYLYYDKAENLSTYIDVFHQDYPGVEVTINRDYVSTDVYFEALDDIMAGDNLEEVGDVVLMDAARMEKYAAEGKLVDLSQYIGDVLNYDTYNKINMSTDLLPAAYDACLYNDSIYMVALEYNHKFVFLNYSLISQVGESFPTDDWTWDDLVRIAEKVKTELNVETPVAMDYTSYEIWGAFARSYGQDIYDYVGNSDDTKRLNLTHPDVVQGIEDMADIVNPERGLVKCINASDIDAADLSKYAFVIADHEDITLWEEYICSEECDFEWDYIHFPRWNAEDYEETGTYYQAIATEVYGFAVINHGITDEYTDEFYRSCAYLALYATVEEAAEAYALDGESVPANKAANSLKFWREYPAAGKNSSVFSNFAETADFAGYLACFMPTTSESEIDIMAAIEAYWNGTSTMMDALQQLQDYALASWIKE